MESKTFTLAEDPKHLQGNEYTPTNTTLPNTVAPIGDESYEDESVEKHEDRFTITPLYTVYHEKALPEEFMIDRHLGIGSIKREDGSVVSGDMIGRLHVQLDRIHDALSYLMIPKAKVYSITPEKSFEVMLYDGVELLDGPCTIDPGRTVGKGVFALDVEVIVPKPEGEPGVTSRLAGIDPEAVIVYQTDGTSDYRTVRGKVSALKLTPIDFNTNQIELVSITFPEITEDDPRELYVYSICVCC